MWSLQFCSIEIILWSILSLPDWIFNFKDKSKWLKICAWNFCYSDSVSQYLILLVLLIDQIISELRKNKNPKNGQKKSIKIEDVMATTNDRCGSSVTKNTSNWLCKNYIFYFIRAQKKIQSTKCIWITIDIFVIFFMFSLQLFLSALHFILHIFECACMCVSFSLSLFFNFIFLVVCCL